MTGPTKRFEQGECIEVERGRMRSLQIAGQNLAWGECDPGWRWSDHVGPMLELERCPVHHRLVLLEGRLTVMHHDGTERTLTAGDVEEVLPGHDAWVDGDEGVVFLDAPVQGGREREGEEGGEGAEAGMPAPLREDRPSAR